MFASEKNFDLVWPQGSNTEDINRFNKFEKPYYADAVQSLFTAFEQEAEADEAVPEPTTVSAR